MKRTGRNLRRRLRGISRLTDRLSRARHFRGHGVHSPFVYGLVREAFMFHRLRDGEHCLYDAQEESYGCLAGTHARDKDAIVAVMCLCEVAAYCKKHNMTLWDMMVSMYEKYGYFKETQYTITMKGIDGARQIAEIMEKLRKNPPKAFGDLKVEKFRDYQNDVIIDMETGEKTTTGLPKSNVLYFELPDNAWCCARPSGTEPKIKFYMGVKGTSLEDAKAKVEKLTEDVKAVL